MRERLFIVPEVAPLATFLMRFQRKNEFSNNFLAIELEFGDGFGIQKSVLVKKETNRRIFANSFVAALIDWRF